MKNTVWFYTYFKALSSRKKKAMTLSLSMAAVSYVLCLSSLFITSYIMKQNNKSFMSTLNIAIYSLIPFGIILSLAFIAILIPSKRNNDLNKDEFSAETREEIDGPIGSLVSVGTDDIAEAPMIEEEAPTVVKKSYLAEEEASLKEKEKLRIKKIMGEER